MKKLLLILVSIVLVSYTNHAMNKNNWMKSFKELEKLKRGYDEASGYSGSMSEAYKHYLKVLKEAPTRIFFSMLEHHNPVVRVYGFFAIIDKKLKINIFQIILKKFEDTEKVEWTSGCKILKKEVADLIMEKALPRLTNVQKIILKKKIKQSGRVLFTGFSLNVKYSKDKLKRALLKKRKK